MPSYLTNERPWSIHFYLYELHYIEHLLWILDQSVLFTEHKHLFYKNNKETMWTLLFYKIVWNNKKIKWNKLLQIFCFLDISPVVFIYMRPFDFPLFVYFLLRLQWNNVRRSVCGLLSGALNTEKSVLENFGLCGVF